MLPSTEVYGEITKKDKTQFDSSLLLFLDKRSNDWEIMIGTLRFFLYLISFINGSPPKRWADESIMKNKCEVRRSAYVQSRVQTRAHAAHVIACDRRCAGHVCDASGFEHRRRQG